MTVPTMSAEQYLGWVLNRLEQTLSALVQQIGNAQAITSSPVKLTRMVPTNAVSYTTVSQFLPANPDRANLILINNGAAPIFVNSQRFTSSRDGVMLQPGSDLSMDRWVGEVWILATADNTPIGLIEFFTS